MSETEVRKARLEVEKSTADFERALDRLLGKVEQTADRLNQITDRTKDITSKMREFVDVDGAVKHVEDSFGSLVDDSVGKAKESALRLIEDVRSAAEEELEKLDSKPLMGWSAVLVGGFLAGFVLARKAAQPR